MTISEILTSALRTSMSVLPMLLMTMGGVASSATAEAASSCPDGVTADDDVDSIVRVNKLTLYSGATSTAIGHFDTSNPREATFVWDQDTGSGTGGLSAWNAQAIIMEIDEILESAPQAWDTNVSLEYAGTLSWLAEPPVLDCAPQ